MNRSTLLCEHCGYPFDPNRTVKGPVICPACGLTAHPHGHADAESPPVKTGRGMPPGLLIAGQALIIGVLLFNTVCLYRTRQTMEAIHQAVTSLADIMLQTDQAQPPPENLSANPPPEDEMLAIQETTLRDAEAGGFSAEDRARYDACAQKLDERYPLYAINDYVKMRRLNGLILRGQFIGVKDDVVLLLQNGQIQNILLTQLDRDSRIRIDPVFREKAIQFQMNRTSAQQSDQQQPSSSGR